jgi:tetratricopeptide (TPR) repeat protein
MGDARCSQFITRCVWLASPVLVGVHIILAATASPFPVLANVATALDGSSSQGSAFSALPPETQGDLLMARGDYAAAIGAYQLGSPRTAVTWNKIGVAYHHLFALEEARKDYQRALSLDPRYPAALNNLGAVYYGEHKYKKAEQSYKRALKYSPGSAVTFSNLGTAYFSDKKYKQGESALQKAMALDPNVFNPEKSQLVQEASSAQQRMALNYFMAKAYATAGKNDLALTYLRKAIEAGFNDRRRLMEDKEFAQLRGTPEFHELMVQQHLD